MAAGAGSGNGAAANPGLRLLTRIGDFIATHTRFDRGHIALQDSRSEIVRVVLRQTYRADINVKRSSAAGELPGDALVVADAASFEREISTQVMAARRAIRSRLGEWSLSHGDDPLSRPAVRDIFRQGAGVGHVELCTICGGGGKPGCAGCEGSGVVPCSVCDASGSSPCTACETKGKAGCVRCYGLGYQMRERRNGEEPERLTCTSCGGAGSTPCDACHGRGRIICAACHGQKKTPCPLCHGSGTRACEPCEGTGQRHVLAQLDCTVSEAWSLTPGAAGPEVARVLTSRASPEELMELADDHRSTVEIGPGVLTRDTIIDIAVTSISVLAGDETVAVHGYGRRQIVRDHANVAGLLLDADIERLATLTPQRMQLPPRASHEMEHALADALASPANVTIMDAGAQRKLDAVAGKSAGGISSDYVRRAAPVIRRAIGTAYWAELARGPALALAAPLLQLPVGWMFRGLGDGSRAAGTVGVMLISVGAVIGAHAWAASQLQERMAPSGVPAIGRLLGKLKLTRTTLIAGSAWAFVGTLIVAGVTSALFPPFR